MVPLPATPHRVIRIDLPGHGRSAGSAADYRVVPGAEAELLPGAGHTPIPEDPARIAALLLPFAATHAVRASSAT